jgi:AraC-like DNA-binding protein
MQAREQEPGFVGDNRPQLTQHVAIHQRAERAVFFGRYRQTASGLGIIEPTALADRVMVSVELNPRGPTDLFEDGRHRLRPIVQPGSLAIFDLRASWAADVRDPFDNLNMFLPLETFTQIAEDHGSSFLGFNYKVEVDQPDETILHLTLAMLPVLAREREASTLFLDHLFAAAAEHVAQTYGAFSRLRSAPRHGLTSRQRDAALEFVESNLAADPSVADLARASSMSISSFARAFKRTLGVPPHQWLLRRRIEKAKRMLRSSNEPLADIAVACGFADQSHLTRVFVRYVGATPRRWRNSI